MLATGHRRLGFALPDDDRLVAFASQRLQGVRRVCAKSGLRPPVTETVALDADSAAAAVDVWTSARPRVTAVCGYNDEVALAVLSGMRLRGLLAPGNLAVVGVDDLRVGALTTPSLTTIATGMSEIGEHLAASVTHILRGGDEPEPPRPELIKLVRRESA